MKRLWTVAVLGAFFTALPQVAASAATFAFSSILTGGQETPPVPTSALGSASSLLIGTPNEWTFESTIKYANLSGSPAAGHIHEGFRGVAGDIEHELASLPQSTSGTIEDVWSSSEIESPAERADTFEDFFAGEYYFNLHTANFPAGEIRGQIEPVPEPSSVLGTLAFGALGAGSLLIKRKKLKKFNGVDSMAPESAALKK